jgi:cobalt ECF transporter T component CbiQ
MIEPLPNFLHTNEHNFKQLSAKHKRNLPFIDRTIRNIAVIIKSVYNQNETASKDGLLQKINARSKIIFLFGFIILISFIRQIQAQLIIAAFLFILFIFSKVKLTSIYKKIFLLGFFFGFLIIAPASLNIVSEGRIIFNLIHFNSAHHFLLYNIPKNIGITYEGCLVVLKFSLRITNSIAITMLVIYTTSFAEIIKSLKIFFVPDLFLLVITLSYKFIFILSHTTEETYFALKSRWWKNSKEISANRFIAERITFIFRKSWIRYEEIYKAMVARGFNGNVNLCYMQKFKSIDIAFLIFVIAFGTLCIYF